MKQRIDPEQLDDLNDLQKKALKEWYVAAEGDWIAWKNNGKQKQWGVELNYNDPDFGFDCEPGEKLKGLLDLPLLSVGQMIEFLLRFPDRFKIANDEDESGNYWCVLETWEPEAHGVKQCWDKKELCDALWEGVKETLGCPCHCHQNCDGAHGGKLIGKMRVACLCLPRTCGHCYE